MASARATAGGRRSQVAPKTFPALHPCSTTRLVTVHTTFRRRGKPQSRRLLIPNPPMCLVLALSRTATASTAKAMALRSHRRLARILKSHRHRPQMTMPSRASTLRNTSSSNSTIRTAMWFPQPCLCRVAASSANQVHVVSPRVTMVTPRNIRAPPLGLHLASMGGSRMRGPRDLPSIPQHETAEPQEIVYDHTGSAADRRQGTVDDGFGLASNAHGSHQQHEPAGYDNYASSAYEHHRSRSSIIPTTPRRRVRMTVQREKAPRCPVRRWKPVPRLPEQRWSAGLRKRRGRVGGVSAQPLPARKVVDILTLVSASANEQCNSFPLCKASVSG